jgi:WD40 repeat protein
VSEEPAAADFKFDAFISYSRKDAAFARRLEQALKAYAPPRDLPTPQRALRVFRDESDFVGTEYGSALRSNLQAARKLLVICSPNAVASRFVDEEIRLFSTLRGPENIVTVLLAGRPNNEAATAPGQDEAFPAALVEALPIPLANDFRGIDPQRNRPDRHQFESAWFKTLADLFADYGISRAQIEQREKRRQAHRRRVTAAISGAVMAALAVLTVWALISRQEAIRQRKLFQSGFLASASTSGTGRGFDLSSLLAVEAYAVAPTPQAREALLLAMQREPNIVKVLPGHNEVITALAISSDGRRVASADKTRVLLWPVAPGSAAEVLPGAAETSSLTFTRTGEELITGHADGAVRVWSLRGKPVLRLTLGAPGRAVTSVALASSDVVVAGYEDGSIRSFHRTTGQEIGEPARQDKVSIATLRVSKDGREFAAITRDGRLSRGRIKDGRVTFDLRTGGGYDAAAVAIGADLALYATRGFGPNNVALLDGRTGQQLGEALPTGGVFVMALAMHPTKSLLAVGLQAGRISLWDTQTRKPLSTTFEDHTADITELAFSADGALLVSGARDGRVVLWSLQPVDRLLTSQDIAPPSGSVAVGGDAGDIIAGLKTGRIEMSALGSRRAPRAIEDEHSEAVTAVAVADQGGRAASGDRSGHVLLWDLRRAEVLTPLPPRSSEIRALRLSRDAARVLVLERSGLLTLWDTTARPPSMLLEAEAPDVPEPIPIALSPDGRTAIVGGYDKAVREWTVSEGSLQKGAKPRILFTHPVSYNASVAFDPAGGMIAMGGGLYEGGVLVWDRARNDFKLPRLGGGDPLPVMALAFSPDGKQLASADLSGEVSLWDVDAGRLIGQPFRVPVGGDIIQLCFAASGNQLFGLTLGGKVLAWNLDPAAWTKIACGIANRGFTAGERQTILLGVAGTDTCAGHR